MTRMTQQQVFDYHQWAASRPPEIRKIAERLVPWRCYRKKSEEDWLVRGHYRLHSIAEGTPITLVVQHLDDSFLPGFGVTGVLPEDLLVCGCVDHGPLLS